MEKSLYMHSIHLGFYGFWNWQLFTELNFMFHSFVVKFDVLLIANPSL